MSVLILLSSTLALLTSEATAQGTPPTIVAQSIAQNIQFTSDYSASWFVYDDGSGNGLNLQVTLIKNNIDTTTWISTDGEYGYWLGIGYGYTGMSKSDITLCEFRYFGQPTDAFTCSDRFAN